MFMPVPRDDGGKEAAAMAETQRLHMQLIGQYKEDEARRGKLTAGDKVMLHAIGMATGTEFFNSRTIDKGLIGLVGAVSAMEQLNSTVHTVLCCVTRFAPPPGSACPPIIVDIMESKSLLFTKPSSYMTINVKATMKTKIRVNSKQSKLKEGKPWRKVLRGPLSTVIIIDKEAQAEYPLEKVLCISQPLTANGSNDVVQNFRKQWVVPNPPQVA